MLRSTVDRVVSRQLHSVLMKLRNRHFVLLDFVVLCLTPVVALLLRLEHASAIREFWIDLLKYALAGIAVRMPIFYMFGLYNRYWRYATIDEMLQIASANIAGVFTCTALYYIGMAFGLLASRLPRSLPLIDGLLALMLVGTLRSSVRLADHAAKQRSKTDADPVLIVGAGGAGQAIVRELLNNRELGMKPVGFIDDDPHKHRLQIQNLQVLGGRDRLRDALSEHGITHVIVALPNAPGRIVRGYVDACEAAGVETRIVPTMSTILQGKFNLSSLRKVEIDDLLRREPIRTDIAAVHEMLLDSTVLVTGGGGSIGGELCRQILDCKPARLVILGHGENSVFEIVTELTSRTGRRPGTSSRREIKIEGVIADIQSAERTRQVVRSVRPDVIFHAAAHKHVPLMEMHPAEAVANNVFGTQNVLDAAMAENVEHLVMISTDKAVNPTSVMGATKRMAELLVMRAARTSGRRYVAVRFGNVLGSRGSVVPLFRRQIQQGGPVTVSHPDVRRYFMTIPEAVQLVLQAAVLGSAGEVLMLDMGEPIRILELAHDLIRLSGLEAGKDIAIEFTGLRPGEKLFEELLANGENYTPTEHDKVLVAAGASSSETELLPRALTDLKRAIAAEDEPSIISTLQRLIPEYQRPGEQSLAEAVVSSRKERSIPLAAVRLEQELG